MSRLTECKTGRRPARRAGQIWQRPAMLALAAMLSTLTAYAQEKYPGVGRSATPQEIAAWDIDVRPDFKGLPKGSGTVADGMRLWEGKCASCHGSFGESNQVFAPLVGGTTREDIQTGRVAALTGNHQPHRTTMMKLSQLSTLWDYIHRAMPWTEPKSLAPDEVYALTAYLLNLAEVVPDDFSLSERNIAEVQQRLPNRNGMTTEHGLWQVSGKPDVKNIACMKNCIDKPAAVSTLPEQMRNANGNIAEQNRLIGPVRGTNTAQPAPAAPLPARDKQ